MWIPFETHSYFESTFPSKMHKNKKVANQCMSLRYSLTIVENLVSILRNSSFDFALIQRGNNE